LWPARAAAANPITITEARLLRLDGNGKVEEATLLLNPRAESRTYELPQFRLAMKASYSNPVMAWERTRVTFTNPNTGKSATACTEQDGIKWTDTGGGTGTTASGEFNLFYHFPKRVRQSLFESLPAGDYQITIQAFSGHGTDNGVQTCETAYSDPVKVFGTLTLKPFQEVIAAKVNGAASARLQKGEKFDVYFTLKNNRRKDLVPGSRAGDLPDSSAGVDMVEWLVASMPPVPTVDNHAPGMNCSEPKPENKSNNFAGTFSSALLKTVDKPPAVPTNIAFGTYNLYLRVHDYLSNSICTGDYGVSPVYELKNAIVVEPQVLSIRVTPSQLLPQPPLTVGKSDLDVVWEVRFTHAVTGVDAGDFRLVAPGVDAPGASVERVSGSGSSYRVATKVPAGSVPPNQLASLQLDFVDDDSVVTVAEMRPVGGPGTGNGDFAGETRRLIGTICGAPNVIWCDDFERSTLGADKANLVGNGWVATLGGDCNNHTPSGGYLPDAGGCAGIDSDIRPYYDYAKPRANASRSMFNRWEKHTVTSKAIDLSGLPAGAAVELSYWLRRGANSFAEEPDRSNDYFRVEYLDKTGKWQVLAAYRSTNLSAVAGEVFRPVFQLPDAALWKGFQLRFSQMGGWGAYYVVSGVNGSDYWFVDDVVLRRVDAPRYAGGFCDNFEAPEASRKQWSFSHEYEDATEGEKWHWGGAGGNSTAVAANDMRVGDAGVTGDVYPEHGSKTHSLFLRWSYVVASTLRIDTSAMTKVPVSYVMQRGMKHAPGKINGAVVQQGCDSTTSNEGNDFVSEYFGSDGAWHALQTVRGENAHDICGQDKSHSTVLTDARAKHENFRLRFRQISKGGWQEGNNYYDYWLVDNVCVGREGNEGFPKADLELKKTRIGDLVPEGVATYVLGVKNLGPDDTMRGDLQIVDTLPAGLTFHEFRGQDWFCEVAGQVLTCNWSGELAVGKSAPALYIYAEVAGTAIGMVKNRAELSSGAVEDPNLDNNKAEDESLVDAVFFHFTKGACRDGEVIGGVDSSAKCSLYRFGGLAGELKGDIHITHVNGAGTRALAFSDMSETGLKLQFALRCLDPTGPPPQGAVEALFGASASPSLSLGVCAGRDDASLPWSLGLGVTMGKGEATAGGVYGFRYADVGRMALNARIEGDSLRLGRSGAFVQKPARLVLSDVVCADGATNPGKPAADGAAFCRAGQPFSLKVAALSETGGGAPNFGRETAQKGVFLEKVLLGPGNGRDPALALPGSGPGGFTGGVATITASWPEVGIIKLWPRLGEWRADGTLVLSEDYLGAGDVPAARRLPVPVGRFYPDHFQTEIGVRGRMGCPTSLAPCPEGGFFYAGQPFELSVLACLYGDETCIGRLENYRDDFAGDVSLSAWGARGTKDGAQSNPPDKGGRLVPVPDGALAGLIIPKARFGGGLFTGRFRYVHADETQPVRQAQGYFRAEERGRDGVSSRRDNASDKSPEAGIAVARGRLRLSNQFGSEKTPGLEIPVQVQFWLCQGKFCDWRASETDATRIEPASGGGQAAQAVSLHPVEGVLPEVAGFELGGGVGRIVLKPKGVGSVNVSVNLGSDDTRDNACNHASGGQEGKAADVPWLRAWNGVCDQAKTGGADPFARASFGVYSGESRKSVHSREVY
jgi:uncharacterized repeat protein (TIGR01451 family)